MNRTLTERLRTPGVVILRVTPGGPAAAAGLQGLSNQPDGSIAPGDIIVAVNQREVDGVPRLLGRLDDFQVGDTVRLTVRRAGQTRQRMPHSCTR